MLTIGQVYSLPIQIDGGSTAWAVTFTPNGEYLVGGHDQGVRVWRVEGGQLVATMEARNVHCLTVSRDGRWIAAGTTYGDVFVWDTKTYNQVIKHTEGKRVRSVEFSPDSIRLVVASLSHTATVLDLRGSKQVQTLRHEDWVLTAKYSPRGDHIATSTLTHVRVWDSNDDRLLIDINIPVIPQLNTGLLWFNDHLLVVSDGEIKELDASTGTTLSSWPVPDVDSWSCVAIPRDGTFIAHASTDTITFWNPSTGFRFCQIHHLHDINSIAFSPDDRFIAFGGVDGRITIQSLSHVFDSIPLPRLRPAFQEPAIRVGKAILNSWKQDQLQTADALLTAAIRSSQNPIHEVLASRALVRARLQQWDAALIDAKEAIDVQPSIIGYIAKSITHIGIGERQNGYQACDLAFEHCHSSHISFLLLIKAILGFMAGEHVNAISRMDDLIATVHHKSIFYAVQAYMHLLRGNSHMDSNNYERAIESFERARARLQHYVGQPPFTVSLISGWRFDGLDITICQRLSEALYSAGRIAEASESLLKLVHTLEKEPKPCQAIVDWIPDFTQRCLSTPGSNAGALTGEASTQTLHANPLLIEWAKATLRRQSWKDALAAAAAFAAPKFIIYWVICERLEVLNRVIDASECLLEMAGRLAHETDSRQARWVGDLKHWCLEKLEALGDNAMTLRQYDIATFRYSAALPLNPANPQALYIKRSKAWANMGSWEDALDDANKIIALDPSSPLGYERKHLALRGAGCHDDAKAAFEIMISKMAQSADPEMRARSRRCVKPAQAEATIRAAVQNAIRESPPLLINTDSGRLLDKPGQASSFESQPIFHELVSTFTTDIDRGHIEDEVGQYYRYATFSHKWKENEPLFDEVVHGVVYELEESPTHTKLKMFCKTARDAGLHWAWSDTCCINKGDPSVLQEALVSMFQWYQSSTLTVVLLCDVPWKRLVESIWNSRAWTFQEYHASKVVRFYNKDWTLYRNINVPNHKESPEIIAEMEEATGISARALMVLQPGLEDIREKLRLASSRQTTRSEDSAYSLLGIFSLSLSVVYGEGDKALGRLLAQLLTSSGDTSILAWTGRSGNFNSCLPAEISAFSQLPTTHIPPPITAAESEIIAGFRSLNRASVTKLYDSLNALPVPLFNGKRMKLPSIIFKLGDVSPSWSGLERVWRAQTDALGIVEIKTEEDVSRFKPLYLVHPWIDFLLDRQPVGSVNETVPEETAIWRSSSIGELTSFTGLSNITFAASQSRTSLASRLGLSLSLRSATRFRDAASLRPPSTLAQTDRQLHALRTLARLRQPFGALLLAPDARNVAACKRVASGAVVTVQVEEITPRILDKLVDSVRVLDVL